jgi:glycine cleavage system aminomethyltransferase T
MPPDLAEPGTAIEIEIFGRWVGGEVAKEPLYDPKGERIRL